MNRLRKALKTINQLGLKQTSLFGLYQLGLRTGHYQRVSASIPPIPEALEVKPLFPVPSKDDILSLLGEAGLVALLTEADVIVDEQKYRQFGGDYVSIELKPPVESPMLNWTTYETGKARIHTDDIKFVWEPARFGWAVPLARAYHLSGAPKYAQKFWELFDEFRTENPYAKGPNWQSGQEVAIRMVTVLLCAPVFLAGDQDAHRRQEDLSRFIHEHVLRILPTLVYARAQNNNHLVTEALGLLCAGYALRGFPEAARWRKRGLRWLIKALESQITRTGEYIQYSNNYHRVMLQSALVATAILKKNGGVWPPKIQLKLEAATRWITSEVDVLSGRVANYGHNDGAYLFSFANGGFADYRPVVQAASTIFLHQPAFVSGEWDELLLWLGEKAPTGVIASVDQQNSLTSHLGIRATLRAHTYHTRPGHADQNHVDLWWGGECVALDAGTYRYNAASPWDNQLMTTAVHNTILVDGQDQMTRAGKFLWLDWSTGKVLKETDQKMVGIHNSYQSLGALHKRSVEVMEPLHWLIVDELVPMYQRNASPHLLQSHWLLPDWTWSINGTTLEVQHDERVVVLQVSCDGNAEPEVQLYRAGQSIYGEGDCISQMGWYSPTYGVKKPALSYVFKINSVLPVRITYHWRFEER